MVSILISDHNYPSQNDPKNSVNETSKNDVIKI